MNGQTLTRFARELNGMARAVPSDGFVQVSLRRADALMVAEACDFVGQADRCLALPVAPRAGDIHIDPAAFDWVAPDRVTRRAFGFAGLCLLMLIGLAGLAVVIALAWPILLVVMP